MDNKFEELQAKINEQRKGHNEDAVYYCGEQILDICRGNEDFAEIVLTDLANAEMSVEKCERKIKGYADKHKKGNCAVVPPKVAEEIIRKFYGLPGGDDEPENAAPVSAWIDLTAYL